MVTPFFSIIMACYNSASFVGKALGSIKSQTFADFEMIFVDDASTDDTLEILNAFKDSVPQSVTVLKNEVNRGPGFSKSRGIEEAKGEYIVCLDSDDWYELSYLERMYETIGKENSDIVQCNFNRVYGGAAHPVYHWKSPGESRSIGFCIVHAMDSLCMMAIKRELFDGVNMPELFNAEDIAVIPVLVSKAEKMSVIVEPLYNYYYRPVSLSNNKTIIKPDSFVCAYDFIRDNISDVDKYREEVQFLGINILLYALVFNGISADIAWSEIKRYIFPFIKQNPHPLRNRYFKTLPLRKRIFISAAVHGITPILKIYAKAHRYILGKKHY